MGPIRKMFCLPSIAGREHTFDVISLPRNGSGRPKAAASRVTSNWLRLLGIRAVLTDAERALRARRGTGASEVRNGAGQQERGIAGELRTLHRGASLEG